jgi:hypothetical protein
MQLLAVSRVLPHGYCTCGTHVNQSLIIEKFLATLLSDQNGEHHVQIPGQFVPRASFFAILFRVLVLTKIDKALKSSVFLRIGV